jgi:uncharacterized protein YjbI with pentapeptide repeats
MTIRDTSADLPAFPADMELTRLSSLDRVTGPLSRFSLDDLGVRELELRDIGLDAGRIRLLRAERAGLKGVSARSLQFTNCNLGRLRWSGGTISKTRFDSCKLLGAGFDRVTLEHVVFTDCKLDYSAFSRIRGAGPVMFVRCSLREAEFEDCHLARALFDQCELVLANFGDGRYAGCDLRGNDLSAVTGIHHLKSVIVDRAQLLQLAEALAAELQVTFGD